MGLSPLGVIHSLGGARKISHQINLEFSCNLVLACLFHVQAFFFFFLFYISKYIHRRWRYFSFLFPFYLFFFAFHLLFSNIPCLPLFSPEFESASLAAGFESLTYPRITTYAIRFLLFFCLGLPRIYISVWYAGSRIGFGGGVGGMRWKG